MSKKYNKHLTPLQLNHYLMIFKKMVHKISGHWIKSIDHGPKSVGDTLEVALGKKLDNKQRPDFFHVIELKGHDGLSSNPITLFTKNPRKINGRSANTIIRNNFGYPDEHISNVKVFHYSATKKLKNSSKSHHRFKLVTSNNKLELVNDDKYKTPKIIAVWTKQMLNDAWNKKTRHDGILVIVNAIKKRKNGHTYFKYTSMKILKHLTISGFLRSLNKRDPETYVDTRLGVYQSGKNRGKKQDNGTAFRMSLKSLSNNVDAIHI